MKPKMPDKLEAGQIWVDEGGDHSIILEVNEDGYNDVKILVISGMRAGEIFPCETVDKFRYQGNEEFDRMHYFLTCLPLGIDNVQAG
jgi:hypothetical protein